MSKPHTLEKKTFALQALRKNGMNYNKTARETGITKTTLRKWHDAAREQPGEIPLPEKITPKQVKDTLLRKIYQLTHTATDIEKLVKALTAICQHYPGEQDKQTSGPDLFERISRAMTAENHTPYIP